MVNRIQERFEKLKQQNRQALIPFLTAGDPQPEMTVKLLHNLVDSGADLLELGIPFSDPMAEGPTIQAACERALVHHVNLHDVLAMVREFREKNQHTPIVLMGYLNPIEQMGYQCFSEKATNAGVDGLIIVDLPLEEGAELQRCLKKCDIDLIFLIAPTSTVERIEKICAVATGYLYYVALKGVTGSENLDLENVASHLKQIRQHTQLPITVGFGVKTPEHAAGLAKMTEGVVVGSSLVALCGKTEHNSESLMAEMGEKLGAMRQAMDQEINNY